MNNVSDNTGSKLNEHQQRWLLITCKHIDELLSEMESILHSSRSESPFPSYIQDISPGQAQFIEDSIRQFRAQLLRTIAWQRIEPNRPDVPASRSMLTYLTFIDIDAEELKPKHMDGYGKVPEGAVDELNGASQALHALSQRLSVFCLSGCFSKPQDVERYAECVCPTKCGSPLDHLHGRSQELHRF